MAKRPWRVHREIELPYTRVSYNKDLNKIPGAPTPKVRLFFMGNKDRNPEDWKYSAHLISLLRIQVSDHALEAVRTNILKYLEKEVKNFLFLIRKFPHHVVREHPIAYGAGADRISQGMRLSFGKPTYRAVQLDHKDVLLSIYFDSDIFIPRMKEYLRIARNKLPGKYLEYVGPNVPVEEILNRI